MKSSQENLASHWAPYSDAIKLIVLPLPELRQMIIPNMAREGLITKSYKDRPVKLDFVPRLENRKRRLKNVQTRAGRDINNKRVIEYYIPDLVAYMTPLLRRWGFKNYEPVPFNIEYLNSLEDYAGNFIYDFSTERLTLSEFEKELEQNNAPSTPGYSQINQKLSAEFIKSNSFNPRDELGRMMKHAGEIYGAKNKLINKQEMLSFLRKNHGVTLIHRNGVEFKYTHIDGSTSRVIEVKTDSFRNRMTRLRNYLSQKYQIK